MAWIGTEARACFYWVSVIAFLLFAVLESARPDRRQRARVVRRWMGHFGLYAADLMLSSVALPVFVYALVTDRAHASASGLFAPVEAWGGGWAVLAAGLLALDLLVYWAHRMQHRVRLLWRFHAVHHADTDMDIGTALLHHPVAYLCVGAFTGFTLLSLGLPAWVFPVYGLFEVAGGVFQHVATPIPDWFERTARTVFVTPGMHQAHHSANPAHHHTNYANILSVWDRVFGTFLALSAAERERIRFGIDGAAARGLAASLTLPFRLRSTEPGAPEAVEQA